MRRGDDEGAALKKSTRHLHFRISFFIFSQVLFFKLHHTFIVFSFSKLVFLFFFVFEFFFLFVMYFSTYSLIFWFHISSVFEVLYFFHSSIILKII